MKLSKFIVPVIVSSIFLGSCGVGRDFVVKEQRYTLELTSSAHPENHYNDLNHGISLYVSSDVQNTEILDVSELPKNQQNLFGTKIFYTYTPTIKEFVEGSLTSYIRSQGITIGRDRNTDYSLKVRVREFKLTVNTGGSRATVILDYTLSDNNNSVILQQTARGRFSSAGYTDIQLIDKAYGQALESIDWNGIASALKVHDRADQEKHRQVTGDGNTALEHTVIRWFITSSPQGADVSWRIVSSTPDVKNTNSTYMGTTPYETTESFNVRGLNFENSGNVQVEVVCEKPGYLTQTRRFNLRQAIEQREISAKFNLVKDE